MLHLFIQSFISVCTHEYLFYTLGYVSVFQYYVYFNAQIVPALAIRSSFSWLRVPLPYPHFLTFHNNAFSIPFLSRSIACW